MGPRRLRKRKNHHRPRWRPSVESLESRRVLSGIPLGALPDDTAEYLLGRVAVTPVFFESNGTIDSESQDWTANEIDGVLQKIGEGMDWWVDTLATLDTVHSLEFVYDDTYARNPVETGYEPIDRTSDAYSLYVGDWLTDRGFGEAKSFEKAIRGFNHQQRLALDADWAFTVVVVDSSDDPNGEFAPGGFGQAFAFAGGMFMVVPSTRPAATFAHEMGHLFWARDEYSGGGSWTDQRGYYDSQNLNAADNPTPGFQQQPSIMSSGLVLAEAYANHVSPASTLAFVGWQDSNGDGVFDVLDVPLHLEGSGLYDAETGLFTFDGAAWAVALENQNPSGLQNDVTLNRISRIEFSVDDGPFITAISPDSQQTEISFSISLPSDFQSIRIRAIDDETGITSPTIDATPTLPGYASATAAGFAFVDENGNGIREVDESVLAGLNARITAIAGRETLPGGNVDPAEYSPGALPGDLSGVTLSAEGPMVDGRVGIATDASSTQQPLLASYDGRFDRWDTGWSSQNPLGPDVFVADFDEPTGDVRIDVIGLDADSIGRMEAYDAEGSYLFRSNTAALQAGETTTLRLQDSDNRIARVRVFGHARTEVALGRLEFGPQWNVASGEHGVVRFENLPDGTYDIQLQPELVIHQLSETPEAGGTVQVTVSGGASSGLAFPFRRVDSPWTNLEMAEDVDKNGRVEPMDALRVINDLNRNGSRNLTGSVENGSFIDTNNDGRVTPTDALMVINSLNRQQRTAEGEQSPLRSTQVASIPPIFAEGEENRRRGGEQVVAEPTPPSPRPPAIEAIDHVFADFAARSAKGAGAQRGDQAEDVEDHPNHLDHPEIGKTLLNRFFQEPFA